MPRVLIANFDFEHHLASAGHGKGALISADLASSWLCIAQPADRILVDAATADVPLPFVTRAQAPRGAEWTAVPWGWSEQVIQLAQGMGWQFEAPPLDIVRKVNSRVYRCELEQSLGIALPGSSVVRSVSEAEICISRISDPHSEMFEIARGWLLKACWGMAGRERLRGTGALREGDRGWLQRRLRRDGAVVFEPLVARICEAGIQFEIPRTGTPQFVGATPLLTDDRGTYLGSRLQLPQEPPDGPDWNVAVEQARRVSDILHGLGYFGPLGVDALWYRDRGGAACLRPLMDLNARWTMGRLALGLKSSLQAGEVGSWLHLGKARERSEPPAPRGNAPGLRLTSPSWSSRRHGLLVANCEAALGLSEQDLLRNFTR